MTFKYTIGETYETQAGEAIQVLGRTDLTGYETLICSDGKHRYDRSDHSEDAGRVTGTPHDYSCPDNFKKGLVEHVKALKEERDRLKEALQLQVDMLSGLIGDMNSTRPILRDICAKNLRARRDDIRKLLTP